MAISEHEDWRAVVLGRLGVTPGAVRDLAAGGIRTLGDFHATRAQYGDHWYNMVRGIAEPKARKIEALCFDFWELRGIDHA